MKTPDPRHWFAPRCAQRPAVKTRNRLLDSWRIIARAVGGTIMLRKGFSIRDSQTKSRLSFKVPDVGPHRTLKRSLFRDPTAIPMLKQIAESLRVKGYEVTEPKPGKACHGACRVIFPDVEISVVLAVRRRQGKIEFEILTWPSQTLRQRFRRTLKSPDCQEWTELCAAIRDILAGDSRLESLRWRAFMEAEDSDNCR
jgi:hypothetical protein